MRLMVYSHDTFGLGNIRRMLAICSHLHASIPDLSILIVSGSPMLQSFRVAQGIDYIKLPCLKRTECGELGVRFLDLEVAEIVRLRRELILSTVVSFRPDIVLVDKKPDGLAGELEPSLRYIRCNLPQTRMLLVLRDILDSSRATVDAWIQHGYYSTVKWYYDDVLVLGDRQIYDVCKEYQFPESLRQKVHFCGYVARPLPTRSRSEIRKELRVADDESLVLVTAGGGQDGYELLSTSVAAASSLAKRLRVRSLLVPGPDLGKEQAKAIYKAARSQAGLQVIEFTNDLMSYMNAADTVISMAGYNTVCELLTLGKRSILVPRVKPVEEQKIRAERMANFAAFRTILPDALTPHILENAIAEQLQAATNDVPSSCYIDLGALARITTMLKAAAPASACRFGVAATPLVQMLTRSGQ
jgi:predicted glycosyltransferase